MLEFQTGKSEAAVSPGAPRFPARAQASTEKHVAFELLERGDQG
jgi:hypothetical protein